MGERFTQIHRSQTKKTYIDTQEFQQKVQFRMGSKRDIQSPYTIEF